MTDTLVVLDHRHPRMLGNETDQAFATARNRQVDQLMQLQQFQHRLAAQVSQHGHGGRRYPVGLQRTGECLRDRGVGVNCLGTTAQDHAVTRLQAQRRGFGGHVRARLVDHRDHAQRHAHLLHADAVRAHVIAGDLADRIWQSSHFAHGFGHREQARRVQCQTIEHGAAHALSRAAARSRALPARINPAFTSSACAIASSSVRRAALSRPATICAASRQARACASISLIGVSFNPVMAAPGRRDGRRCRRSCSRARPGCRANGGRQSGVRRRQHTG